MENNKELKVSAIKDGTVIDHIPAQNLFKVISLLGLADIENAITFGTNLESKKLGRKSIIKVADKFFRDDEIDKIALVAPEAKLNIIRNYEVVEKRQVSLPDEITGYVRCFNPKCITNHEDITTRFTVVSKLPLALKCHYCDKVTTEEHLTINS
ncbi:MAG: aspartate carbamoyltransferase regulatory subunit [Marinilabiliaceae bacterium]|nr:aspartate carbamoyltransferase regulatory subunit [Bacteroidales bacterium]MDD5814937.1 aspartate carbamoyltransferase regulatory subunit [Bacteroidales bacterium]MDY4521240.1 aspartate carbamoyltransferase regulatory subunit [Bacteroidales bacterium]